MKKILIVLTLNLLFNLNHSLGQFYIQPSIGYTLSTSPMQDRAVLTVNNLKTVYEAKQDFGEGLHLGLNLGYNLGENFLFEINSRNTIFTKQKSSIEEPNLQELNNFSYSGRFGDTESQTSIFQIAPLFGVRLKFNKFSPYFKIGPNFMKSTVSMNLKYIKWEIDNMTIIPTNAEVETEYTGKLHIGLQSNLGFCYSIKPNINIVFDIVSVSNNYKITKMSINKYEIDGVSHLDEINQSYFEIDKINLSHYGLSIGLMYIFDNK
jgi:hypothetical protein